MTREGWRECVLEAVRRHHDGDESFLDILSQLLEEQDEAKQILRDKGYGCTGMPWKEMVEEVGRVQ